MSEIRKLTAMAAVLWLCGIAHGSEADGFSPHVIVVVDESGSMTRRQDWLEHALPALGDALDYRNLNVLPNRMYFSLAGFTTRSRDLARYASATGAADAVSALHQDGGTEDGYVAIREVLSDYLAGDDYAPTTVILVTDEDRDATDRDLTLDRLSALLIANGIVVHAVTTAMIVCPDESKGVAVDRNLQATKAGPGGQSTCEAASVQSFDDYAELAWATGGLVWDLGMIAGISERLSASKGLQRVVDVLADHIMTQWPTGSLWTDVTYSPRDPRPGDIVTFDGSRSASNEPDGRISAWQWDLDGDGSFDRDGSTVSHIYAMSGRYRIELNVTNDSEPPVTGRKVVYLQVSE